MKLLAGLLALWSLTLSGAAMSGSATSGSAAPPRGPGAETPASAAPIAPADAGTDPHEHGIARLRIRVDADLLELRLRVPLQTLLGVETAPRTEKQRQAVRAMAKTLRQPQALFVPTAEAACTPEAVSLRSEAISPELLAGTAGMPAAPAVPTSGTPAAAGRKRAPEPHANLEADITFRCSRPKVLTGLQVRMFEAFPALRRVDVGIVTPRGDSGARLSPNRSSLTW